MIIFKPNYQRRKYYGSRTVYNQKKKRQHLKLVERGKIESYLEKGMTKAEIARKLNVSERTIYREIRRGTVEV